MLWRWFPSVRSSLACLSFNRPVLSVYPSAVITKTKTITLSSVSKYDLSHKWLKSRTSANIFAMFWLATLNDICENAFGADQPDPTPCLLLPPLDLSKCWPSRTRTMTSEEKFFGSSRNESASLPWICDERTNASVAGHMKSERHSVDLTDDGSVPKVAPFLAASQFMNLAPDLSLASMEFRPVSPINAFRIVYFVWNFTIYLSLRGCFKLAPRPEAPRRRDHKIIFEWNMHNWVGNK